MILLLVVGVLLFRVSGTYLTLEHCTKIKFSIYVHQTLMYTKCVEKDNIIIVGGVYISVWNSVGR